MEVWKRPQLEGASE